MVQFLVKSCWAAEKITSQVEENEENHSNHDEKQRNNYCSESCLDFADLIFLVLFFLCIFKTILLFWKSTIHW